MDEEFDLEKFNAEYEAANKVEETDEIEDVVEEEQEFTDEDIETFDEAEEDEEVQEEVDNEESELNPNAESEAERNRAFAQLRRERDEAKKLADWISQVAEQNGTSPEEMMKNYQQASLQKEAETKGVPVDLLQRMKTLEEENATIKNQTFAERFNADVSNTISKYGATESEVDATFQYMKEKGLMDGVKSGQFSFEELHKLAHLDTLVEKKSTEAVQKSLSSKKKRQQEAPLPNGSGAADLTDSLQERAKADAKRYIEEGF